MEHLTVELAHRLIRGQLDAQAHAHWENHLQDCPGCRKLLTEERAWSNVLDLGQEPSPPATAEGGRMKLRADQLPGQSAVRGGRRYALTVGGVVTALLAVMLVWQLSATRARPATGKEPRIPAELEAKVVANLDELTTLRRDPWLAEEYETVRMLEKFIASHQP